MQKFKLGLNKYESWWMWSFISIITVATLYFSATGTDWSNAWNIILNWIISPLGAITGVICVVLVAKGNLYNYAFGIVNAIGYGTVAWQTGYYGDWLLNWFFFLPTQIFILIYWKNHLREKTEAPIVKMRKLTPWQVVYTVAIGITALIGFGLVLHGVDWWFVNYLKKSESMYGTIAKVFGIPLLGPMFDSSTEVLQIIAQILLIKRMAEQWPLWIATNVITIIMWVAVMIADPTSIPYALPTFIMWVAYLINSVYGTKVWYRDVRIAENV